MPDTNIAFANIVPNTAPASWSQAYNAGKLFAVLSLQKELQENETSDSELAGIGKEVISTFEQEFFTLENKDLDSIKNAIALSIEKIKSLPFFSFVITYISGSVLYVFIAGSGSVVLKRGSKLGAILESDNTQGQIKSGSGFLQNDDLIILQTKNFSKVVSVSSLAAALDSNNPSVISEILAPKIHEKADGAAACAILLYKDDKAAETLAKATPELSIQETANLSQNLGEAKKENFEEISLDSLTEPETTPKEPEAPKIEEVKTLPSPPLSELVLNSEEESEPQMFASETKKRSFSLPIPKIGLSGLNHRRRLLLSVALLIVIALAVSIFLGIRNKNDQKVKDEFAAIYPKAQQKYNEGNSLKDLNADLALEDFKAARDILAPNKDKFKTGSSEDKQIESLLDQVNSAMGSSPNVSQASSKEVSASSSDLLSAEINNPSVVYFTKDSKNVYFLDGTGIQQVSKSTQKKTLLVKRSWTTEAGIGVFGVNLYVLDRGATQVFKFSPPASGSAYLRSAYLASASSTLADATAMTIDGSIYVLSKTGTIQKFLRGNQSAFSITGLSKNLSNPTRIQTDADAKNLYIMDNGNSRIVVLDKTGKFIKEYPASVIKNAKDFEILEASNKIYILSGNKIYQIDLK